MAPNKHKHQNELLLCRRKCGLSRKRVAALIGHRDTAMLRRYETGRAYPPLVTALALEIVYRTPVAYLYYDLYASLRQNVRREEGVSIGPCQPTLF